MLRALSAAIVVAGTLFVVGGANTSGATGDPLVVAAGDIACDPDHSSFNGGNGSSSSCRQRHTAALLRGATAVLPLGDVQYEDGAHSKFLRSYAPSWGAFKSITRPVPGNHEYLTPGAKGYFQYFGTLAHEPGKGYYSFDLGAWHLIALNSTCSGAGGCGPGSRQLAWLEKDLAATTKSCILAYWHHPRFSSGVHGNDADYDGFWRALYAAHADVVLTAHDHDYERFALQDPNAGADPDGIREFVVGTGGRSLRPFEAVQPNSQVRHTGTFGVLRLTLHPRSYDWRFVPANGTFTDRGSTACHAGPTPVALSSFSAKRATRGMLVRWRTSGETAIRGYILYREKSGQRIRLNRALIAASGRPAGRAYSWFDRGTPAPPLQYRLQAVDVNGRRSWLGAITVSR